MANDEMVRDQSHGRSLQLVRRDAYHSRRSLGPTSARDAKSSKEYNPPILLLIYCDSWKKSLCLKRLGHVPGVNDGTLSSFSESPDLPFAAPNCHFVRFRPLREH
jgi:hypothetical protein